MIKKLDKNQTMTLSTALLFAEKHHSIYSYDFQELWYTLFPHLSDFEQLELDISKKVKTTKSMI